MPFSTSEDERVWTDGHTRVAQALNLWDEENNCLMSREDYYQSAFGMSPLEVEEILDAVTEQLGPLGSFLKGFM